MFFGHLGVHNVLQLQLIHIVLSVVNDVFAESAAAMPTNYLVITMAVYCMHNDIMLCALVEGLIIRLWESLKLTPCWIVEVTKITAGLPT